MIILLVVVGVALYARSVWPAPERVPPLIEVTGDVPRPGLYAVPSGSVHGAILEAGGQTDGIIDRPVPHGFVVHLGEGGATVRRPADPVLVALPIDPNTADRTALTAIPGITETTADRIIGARAIRGFRTMDDLRRAGLSARRIDAVEPFMAILEPAPLDLNRASAAQLESLPGIGPVLAARIVVDRAERGRFASIDALTRVKGVGPRVIDGISDLTTVTP